VILYVRAKEGTEYGRNTETPTKLGKGKI